MCRTRDFVLTLDTLLCHLRTPNVFELFVLSTKEFVLRDEGEILCKAAMGEEQVTQIEATIAAAIEDQVNPSSVTLIIGE